MKSHGLMLQVLTPTLTLAVEGMPTSNVLGKRAGQASEPVKTRA
jgi:hypothetical protein